MLSHSKLQISNELEQELNESLIVLEKLTLPLAAIFASGAFIVKDDFRLLVCPPRKLRASDGSDHLEDAVQFHHTGAELTDIL